MHPGGEKGAKSHRGSLNRKEVIRVLKESMGLSEHTFFIITAQSFEPGAEEGG